MIIVPSHIPTALMHTYRTFAQPRTRRASRQLIAFLAWGLLLVVPILVQAQQPEPVLDPDGAIRRLEEASVQGRQNQSARESGEDIQGRDEWFRFQRAFPYDRIEAGSRAAAFRTMKGMEERMALARAGSAKGAGLLAAPNRWEAIGPTNISGRTRGLAVDPVNTGTIYCGAAAGGVWKTTNGGTSWQTTTDTLSSLAFCALAIDHTDRNIIYGGTGENSINVDAYLGDGIFKSTDGGITWKNNGKMSNIAAFSKIYVHRQNHLIVYAAATKGGGGFYLSSDGGDNWTRIVSGSVYDMSVNPQNSDEVMISFSNGIRRSSDGGKTFTTAQAGINFASAIRTSVAIAPSDPNRAYALVGRGSSDGTYHIGEVYSTTDKGTNWTLVQVMPQNFFNLQAWYDHCIAVHPEDPDVVLVGGIDVYQSIDGGQSFTNSTRSYLGGPAHADQHVLEFDPGAPGIVYLGNDGGLYLSPDAGGSWTEISKTLPTTQYYALDVDQTRNYRVYGGTQDNGSHGTYGTTGFDTVWKSVLGGDGFFVIVDTQDPNYIYAENFNGTPLYRINANNTNSRTRLDAIISPNPTSGDLGTWSTPIAMSVADKKSLYTGRTGLWRSVNNGSNWTKLTPGNSSGASGKIQSIGLSELDANKLIIGTIGGDVRYSVDYGVTWKQSTGYPGRTVTDLRYDPVVNGRVYGTFSGTGSAHVYRSDDNGATFKSISSNLPDISANAIEVDPTNNSHLFVGTDIGVFASLDGGEFWFPYNYGLALSPIAGLRIHRSTRTMVAATHGRSMFRVSIDNIQITPTLIAPLGGETFVTPRQLEVRWAGFTAPVRVSISYNGGANWTVIADNVVGSSTIFDLPLIRTSNARVKVELVSGGDLLASGDFNLTAQANVQTVDRSIIAEALEVRDRDLWATIRGSDTIYRYQMPLLTNLRKVVRKGITGHPVDMAYDKDRSRFYILTANSDFSGAKLWVMDTTGAAKGEIPLPAPSIAGVTVLADGIAVTTPGAEPTVHVIDTAGTAVRQIGPLTNAPGTVRRGLAWDDFGFLQGANRTDPGLQFPTEIQHLTESNPFMVRERGVIVPTSSNRLEFFGLAIDRSDTSINSRLVWASDTSGLIYKFTRGTFLTSSVLSDGAVAGYRSSEVSIASISPNPMRGETSITVDILSRRDVTVGLFDATGRRLLDVFDGTLESGRHTLTMRSDAIPSGIYYLAVAGGDGHRDVRPVVVVK